jgi:hypothetical protein
MAIRRKYNKELPFIKSFAAGLVMGFAAIIGNNVWRLFYAFNYHLSVPLFINFENITFLSLGACFSASIYYFLISKILKRPFIVYSISILVFVFISILLPAQALLPDGSPKPEGFLGLTIPMHFITGLSAIYISIITRKKHEYQ